MNEEFSVKKTIRWIKDHIRPYVSVDKENMERSKYNNPDKSPEDNLKENTIIGIKFKFKI